MMAKGEVVGRHEVVDRDHVQVFAEKPLFDQSAKHQATNPPKPVDSNLHGRHSSILMARGN